MENRKIAYIFPGQGAQYPGMGKDLFLKYDDARKTYDFANDIFDFDVANISFNGTEEQLRQTEIAQPVVFTHSMACLSIFQREYLRENGEYPDFHIAAGHSLGEYAALVAAGIFQLRFAFELIKERARCMSQVDGAMAAIQGFNQEELGTICKETNIQIANYNSHNQLVIAGKKEDVYRAVEIVERITTRHRIYILDVSGPFHTDLMKGAADEFRKSFYSITLQKAQAQVVSNVTGDYIANADIRDLLYRQIFNPVLWDKSVRRMLSDRVDTVIEFGGGIGQDKKRPLLTGLVRSIYRDMREKGHEKEVQFLSVIDESTLRETIRLLTQTNF